MLFTQLLEKTEYTGIALPIDVDHITNDSREARSGSIFVCVRGFATDGHLYALRAYENGCRAFVCERFPDMLPKDACVVIVKDSRRALALLSAELYRHPSKELTVIGITGTKGKTTTALMIKQLLDLVHIPCGYVGSNGIIFGSQRIDSANTTPESYKLQEYVRKMVDNGIKAVVMEISSQALKLDRTLGMSFDVTLFTNFSPDHIGPTEHHDLEDYFQAKKKLFDNFSARMVIANADDPKTDKMLADCKSEKFYYSVGGEANISAQSIGLLRSEKMLGASFDCIENGNIVPCSLAVPGEFNIHNALAAISVARVLGIDYNDITEALAKMNIEGRFEALCLPNGACFVIDYAHNGLSLRSALLALREYEPRRLFCLFGSVGCRTQVRRSQMGEVASRYADFSILTSDNPDTENPQSIIDEIAIQYSNPDSYISIPDRAEAIRYACSVAQNGDIVLLAGKGHERYQLINGKKQYFCEREIIEDCINSQQTVKNSQI